MSSLRNKLPLYYDFYLVAKELSFTKASEKNYIAQPSLSRNVKNLEEMLGLTLINRHNKGVELTLDGEKLFKKLDKAFVNFLNDDLNVSNEELVGKITIGITRNIADYKFAKYLYEFKKTYPNVEVGFIMTNATKLDSSLKDHSIDLLIDYLPKTNYSEKYDFEVVAIDHFNTCFACSKETYESGAKNIRCLKDLQKYPLIIPGKSRRREFLDKTLQTNNISLIPDIQMPDSKFMIDYVSISNHIGYFIEEELEDTELIKIDITEELPNNSIGMIYSKHTINNVARKFVELVLKMKES